MGSGILNFFKIKKYVPPFMIGDTIHVCTEKNVKGFLSSDIIDNEVQAYSIFMLYSRHGRFYFGNHNLIDECKSTRLVLTEKYYFDSKRFQLNNLNDYFLPSTFENVITINQGNGKIEFNIGLEKL